MICKQTTQIKNHVLKFWNIQPFFLSIPKYSCLNTMTDYKLPFASSNTVIWFFLCLRVALAWKNLVPASPNLTHLYVPLCFQYILCCFSNEMSLLDKASLKFHSWIEKSLHSLRISRKYRTNLTFAMFCLRLDNWECQALRTLLKFLNLVEIILTLPTYPVGTFHPCWTFVKNSSCYLKIEPLGTFVEDFN